ncbi:M2 family metallopeptidase [bacterium]|nr:M2 family metallopeptidase [bacterium]
MIAILSSFLNPVAAQSTEEAIRFIEKAEAQLLEETIASDRAAWVQANFITYDTQFISAAAEERLSLAGVELAKEATRFDKLQLEPELRRRLDLLKQVLTSLAPSDPKLARELAQIAAKLKGMYGEGKYCPSGKSGDDCLDVNEITKTFAEVRDPGQLLDVWKGWHSIAPPMRVDYKRFVELQNQGAKELGYQEVGSFWRSKYDMPPDDFAAELERLWTQVRPLYESLHCYVRAKLGEKYGTKIVPQDGPIPAHLLGNIWAQDWSNIYELVAPADADPGYDLTKIIQSKNLDAKEMTRIGEGFFVSLGLDPLPKTFWERSLFTKPRDREVVCHASAWDIDQVEDLRIKMCIEPNGVDFRTIHHELGHNFYQRAYNQLPFIYRQGANDGFHEAIGDTIALSVPPTYLKQIGFIQTEPPSSKDIGLLLKDALGGVAFLPFGLLIDQWRWKVFSGSVKPEDYNKSWWELREKYQGVSAPVARTESDFDPGAKYHVPANVPYTRYFLARILQYQFHRALCETAGYKGVLNRCTIYGNKAAGERLKKMLEMGISRPWADALEAATGERQMDGTALLEYYAPLKSWLEKENEGRKCGW